MLQRLRLARVVVELVWVGGVFRNDRNNVGIVILVVALAKQIEHVAAANDGVGGEQADTAQHQRSSVALALCGVVD